MADLADGANVAFELASTIQSAHINPNPDPTYDLNPSTAASKKSPVRLRRHAPLRRASSIDSSSPTAEVVDVEAPLPSDQIPISVLEPPPRKTTLPPLPDLRFEQSYLVRIRPFSHPANGGPPQYLWIAWYTFVDHVFLPLTQGLLWNLVVHGWRTWNTATSFQGHSAGARLRRWWWGVNNWGMPGPSSRRSGGVAKESIKVAGMDLGSRKTAKQAEEFFVSNFGSAGMD